jgi:hypothetical protein
MRPNQHEPIQPTPIQTRIPQLTAQVEQLEAETDKAVANYRPKNPTRIDDLSLHILDLLKQLPGVGKVEVLVAVEKPTQRIIHLADWHFVPRNLFDIEMEQAHGRKLTEADKDALYRQLLLQVEVVQIQQLGVLRCLIKHHGLKQVFQEGLTKERLSAFKERVEALDGIPALREQLIGVRQLQKTAKGERLAMAKAIEKEVLSLIEARKPELLEIGAAGQMYLTKELASVLPLDDSQLLDEAKPVIDGKVKFDAEKVKRREAVMVKAVLDNGKFGLIVLGASHDLSVAVRERSGSCEYIRVWVKEWPG